MPRLVRSPGILAMLLTLVLGTTTIPAAAQGTSKAAHACQQGGYQHLVRAEDGSGFTSTGTCVSYAAQGGWLIPAETPFTPAQQRCITEAWAAGLDPWTFDQIVAGDDGPNTLEAYDRAGTALFCGFGGDDFMSYLGEGDVFLGGGGDDLVGDLSPFSTFYGGEGNDLVSDLHGAFYGGPGNDHVDQLHTNATYDGGEGHDTVVQTDFRPFTLISVERT